VAKWRVYRRSDGEIAVGYINLYSFDSACCGSALVSVEQAIEWIVSGSGGAIPGDYIVLPDGGYVYFSRTRGAA
jgi:hypothetical protein